MTTTKLTLQQLINEETYWDSVLNDASKEDVLMLAKKLDIVTHYKNSKRQVDLSTIKANIKSEKVEEFKNHFKVN